MTDGEITARLNEIRAVYVKFDGAVTECIRKAGSVSLTKGRILSLRLERLLREFRRRDR